MATERTEGFDRDLFTARALAYLCLHFADLGEKTVLERADFLMGLGSTPAGGGGRNRLHR